MEIIDVRCDRCGYIYRKSGLRKCRHEAVIAKYGENICRYCCMKCKHVDKSICTLNIKERVEQI